MKPIKAIGPPLQLFLIQLILEVVDCPFRN